MSSKLRTSFTGSRRVTIDDHLSSGAEFLAAFTKAGWPPEDVAAVGRAFHVAHREIEEWAAKLPKKPVDEVEKNISIIAAGAEVALKNRGRVVTPAVLEAAPAQLLDFIDFYEAELDLLWDALAARAAVVNVPGQDFAWLEVRARFDRLAGFLWESRTQSGVLEVLHPREVTA